jgi:hypothetical protein
MKQYSLSGSIARAALIGPALVWFVYLVSVFSILLFRRDLPPFDSSLVSAAGLFIFIYFCSVVVSLLGILLLGLPLHLWASSRGFVSLPRYLFLGAVGGRLWGC